MNGIEGKFELEARDIISSQSDAALVSIAVSLKRIADVLDGSPEPLGRRNLLIDIANNTSYLAANTSYLAAHR